MKMTLGEIRAWLESLASIAPEDALTNVSSISLEGLTTANYDQSYGYRNEPKRVRELSVKFESASDASPGLHYDPSQNIWTTKEPA